MTGVEVAAGAAVVGVGSQVYGAITSASAKADAAKQDAALKNQQADELVSREKINEQILLEQSDLQQRDYGASIGAVQAGSIGGILQIRKNTAQTIANDNRDAAFKAQMLRAGANIATNLASDEQASGIVTGAGTLLSAGLKGASYLAPASTATQSLPKVGE